MAHVETSKGWLINCLKGNTKEKKLKLKIPTAKLTVKIWFNSQKFPPGNPSSVKAIFFFWILIEFPSSWRQHGQEQDPKFEVCLFLPNSNTGPWVNMEKLTGSSTFQTKVLYRYLIQADATQPNNFFFPNRNNLFYYYFATTTTDIVWLVRPKKFV